ncbi:MAG: prolipoprotein diacylglyceryl transferase [Bacteroidetes bacterium]|nr:prolipoprotein diacylglyceryl transferase [Bacteroidota bacterium]
MIDILGIVWRWNVKPEIVQFGDSVFGLRYYSLLWALSFIIGFYIVKAIFENEKKNLDDLDNLFMTMLLGTILGARIGHCLFYDFHYYFIENPLSILKVWEGGLASHGALIGIMIALFIFVKKHSDYKKLWPIKKIVNPKYTYLWILDRIVIPVALAGGFIRMGNFFNSEIVGKYTDGFFGVHFVRHFDHDLGYYDKLPRVPVQLYEAICYFIIFAIIYRYYWKTKGKFAPGLLFGFFLVTVFGARFILEFWKIADVTYGGLNTGHVLSIPVVIIGLIIWLKAIKKQKTLG